MKTLEEVIDQICELKGTAIAKMCVTRAIIRALPPETQQYASEVLQVDAEAARSILLGSPASERTLAAFEREIRLVSSMLDRHREQP